MDGMKLRLCYLDSCIRMIKVWKSLYQSIQLKERLATPSEEDSLYIYRYLYITAEQCDNYVPGLDIEEASLADLKEAIKEAYKYIDN